MLGRDDDSLDSEYRVWKELEEEEDGEGDPQAAAPGQG
jgi:hypothetical protein